MGDNGKPGIYDVKTRFSKIIIGDQEMIMRPLKIYQIRRFGKLFNDIVGDMANIGNNTNIMHFLDIVLDNAYVFMKEIFPDPPYGFFTKEFYDQNIDNPTVRFLFDEFMALNRFDDIYPMIKKIMSTGEKQSITKTTV